VSAHLKRGADKISNDKIDITITSNITENDWNRLTTWRADVFSPEGKGMEWIGGKMHIIASSKGAAIGHIGFDVYRLILDGQETDCIGVGAVVVIPEHQGKSLPARMFTCLRKWRDEKHPRLALALFCPKSLVSYYNRHGFEESFQEVYYIQKGDFVISKFSFMLDRSIDVKSRIDIPTNPW
jgi:GNAT superfamily N-acetyltransferase